MNHNKAASKHQVSPIRLKLWWLDVVYPSAFAALLILGFTYVIYHGQKHRQLSSKFEEKFLKKSLLTAGPRPALNNKHIINVTFRESDVGAQKANPNIVENASISSIYNIVIEKIIASNAKYIVIEWNNQALSSYQDYLTFSLVLKSAKKDQKVILAVPPLYRSQVPQFISDIITVLDSDSCQEGLQLICVYNSQWDDWIIQELARDLWSPSKNQFQVISKNLPRNHESFILDLSDSRNSYQMSFSQVLSSKNKPNVFKEQIVFVGRNINTSIANIQNPEHRVSVLFGSHHFEQSGTNSEDPIHIYWSRIAQLFLDNDLITIAPKALTLATALILSLGLTYLLLSKSMLLAFSLLSILGTSFPYLNGFCVRIFRFYTPVFDIIYIGASSLIFCSFVRLSLASFHSWRQIIQDKYNQDTADAKQNFLALISHNLNTPVAKMKGMLDILLLLPQSTDQSKELTLTLSIVTKIQLCLKLLLITTTLEDDTFKKQTMTIDVISKNLEQSIIPLLSRMGMQIQLSKPQADPFCQNQLPLITELKMLEAAIASISVLIRPNSSITHPLESLVFELGVDEDKRTHKPRLKITIKSLEKKKLPATLSFLANPVCANDQIQRSESILEYASSKLILTLTKLKYIEIHFNQKFRQEVSMLMTLK